MMLASGGWGGGRSILMKMSLNDSMEFARLPNAAPTAQSSLSFHSAPSWQRHHLLYPAPSPSHQLSTPVSNLCFSTLAATLNAIKKVLLGRCYTLNIGYSNYVAKYAAHCKRQLRAYKVYILSALTDN